MKETVKQATRKQPTVKQPIIKQSITKKLTAILLTLFLAVEMIVPAAGAAVPAEQEIMETDISSAEIAVPDETKISEADSSGSEAAVPDETEISEADSSGSEAAVSDETEITEVEPLVTEGEELIEAEADGDTPAGDQGNTPTEEPADTPAGDSENPPAEGPVYTPEDHVLNKANNWNIHRQLIMPGEKFYTEYVCEISKGACSCRSFTTNICLLWSGLYLGWPEDPNNPPHKPKRLYTDCLRTSELDISKLEPITKNLNAIGVASGSSLLSREEFSEGAEGDALYGSVKSSLQAVIDGPGTPVNIGYVNNTGLPMFLDQTDGSAPIDGEDVGTGNEYGWHVGHPGISSYYRVLAASWLTFFEPYYELKYKINDGGEFTEEQLAQLPKGYYIQRKPQQIILPNTIVRPGYHFYKWEGLAVSEENIKIENGKTILTVDENSIRDALDPSMWSYDPSQIDTLKASYISGPTVTFNTNGGELKDTDAPIREINYKNREDGRFFDISEVVPLRDGYTFAGWYASPDCTEDSRITDTEDDWWITKYWNNYYTKDIQLYAKWNITAMSDSDTGVSISMTNGVPQDAVFSATIIEPGLILESRPELEEHLPGLLSIYNLSIRYNEKLLEIRDNPMTVKIPLIDSLKGFSCYQAVSLGDPLKSFDTTVEGDFLVFETDRLSQYAILGSDTPFEKPTAIAYPITVNGIPVTTANAADILGKGDGNGATASYDPDTHTLILDHAALTSRSYGAVRSEQEEPLTLVLKGENRISGEGENPHSAVYSDGPVTIKGDGSLITDGTYFGLYCSKTISIEDGATVDLTVAYSDEEQTHPYAAVCAEWLTVDKATLHAKNNADKDFYYSELESATPGIYTSLTARNGAKVEISSDKGYGILGKNVIISGSGTEVTATGAPAIYVEYNYTDSPDGKFTVSDGAILTAQGSYAMYPEPDLTGYTNPVIVAGNSAERAEIITDPSIAYRIYKYVQIRPTVEPVTPAPQPHEHKFGGWQYHSAQHWKECSICGEKIEEADHSFGEWKVTKNPTTKEEGSRKRNCIICGFEQTETIPVLKHTHSYGSWQKDASKHWKTCSCGAKTKAENHKFGGWTVTRKATLTKTGSKKRTCSVCKYTQTSTIPVLKLQAPKAKLQVSTNSIKLTWNKVSSAKGYVIYKKTGNGKLKKLATLNGATRTSYTDKKVTSGSKYSYQIKSFNGKKYSSYSKAVTTIYLSSQKPTVKKMSNGIRVSYKKIKGARGYVIYRKTAKGKWTKLKTINKANAGSFLDKKAKKGTTYQYMIKAKSGNYYSAYTASTKIKR